MVARWQTRLPYRALGRRCHVFPMGKSTIAGTHRFIPYVHPARIPQSKGNSADARRRPHCISARGRRLSRIDSTGSMRKNWQNSFGATRKLFPFASNAVTPYMLSTSTSCIKRRGKPPLATSSHAISRLRAAPQTRPIWHWCANPTPQSVMHDSICPVVGPSGFLAIVAPGLNPH